MKTDDDKHAELSPSGAHRWMACPGSVVLEAGEPDSESDYAAEGTLAHALATHCLNAKTDTKDILFLDQRGEKEIIPMDMREYVQDYIDYVREEAKDCRLLVEQKLDLEWLTGEKDATCTADALMISKDGTLLKLPDFKYGMGVFVSAKNNPQTRMYGLCALEQFQVMGDFEKAQLGIHQPRMENVGEETLTIEELNAFANDVRQAVKRVNEAKRSNSLDGFLHPGKKQCQFCRAKAKCPALASLVVEATAADFEDETQTDVTQLIDPVDPHLALTKVELIELWCKGVRGKVESDLLSGASSKHWKLVEGKLGNRKWKDEAAMIKAAKKIGATDEDIFGEAPLSPAKIEKRLKKKPKILAVVSQFWKRTPGDPSVARIDDPRAEYNPTPADDYDDVSESIEIPKFLQRAR